MDPTLANALQVLGELNTKLTELNTQAADLNNEISQFNTVINETKRQLIIVLVVGFTLLALWMFLILVTFELYRNKKKQSETLSVIPQSHFLESTQKDDTVA